MSVAIVEEEAVDADADDDENAFIDDDDSEIRRIVDVKSPRSMAASSASRFRGTESDPVGDVATALSFDEKPSLSLSDDDDNDVKEDELGKQACSEVTRRSVSPPLAELIQSVNSALEKLDQQAREVDEEIVEVYEGRRRRRSSMDTGRRWRASSQMEHTIDREATIATRGIERQMNNHKELMFQLAEKTAELDAAIELNRELNTYLTSSFTPSVPHQKTRSDSLEADLESCGNDVDALKELVVARSSAYKGHCRQISEFYVKKISDIKQQCREEADAKRRLLLQKIASTMRAFKIKHENIVQSQQKCIEETTDRLRKSEEKRKSQARVIDDRDLKRCGKTLFRTPCCERRDGGFDLSTEIDHILDGRFDWKGDMATKVRHVTKTVLLEIIQMPETARLVRDTNEAVLSTTRLDPDATTSASEPTNRKLSTQSSIRNKINEEIEAYPPSLRDLFQNDSGRLSTSPSPSSVDSDASTTAVVSFPHADEASQGRTSPGRGDKQTVT